MCEKQIFYPVDKRDFQTLCKIIKRHVIRGAMAYTDGWVGYTPLDENGYHHFRVIHKDRFKKNCKTMTTGIKSLLLASCQRAAHAHRVDIITFEQHLAEVVWRNHNKGSPGDVFVAFYKLLSFHLQSGGSSKTECTKALL